MKGEGSVDMNAPDAADARRLAEEVVNSVTHGVGLVLSLAGLVVLMALATARGTALEIAAFGIYGATLVALYAASTLYHGCTEPRRKRTLRVVDHCAVFLLIAGSYTPITLVSLPPGWGWTLFTLVWLLAAVGIVYKLRFLGRFPRAALGLYLLMGWLAVLALKPILTHLPAHGVILLFGGGLLYTAGVWFYVRDHLPYRHGIWHLFVLGGSIAHYFAILTAVLPPATA
jgi:hemolysin III